MPCSYLWGFFFYLRNRASGILFLNSFSEECGPRSSLHQDTHSSLNLHLLLVSACKQLPADGYPAPALLGWGEIFARSTSHPVKPCPMGEEYACNGKHCSLLQTLWFSKFNAFIGAIIPVFYFFFLLISQLFPNLSYQNSWTVPVGTNYDGQSLI